MQYSRNWTRWRAFVKPSTCDECFWRNGKIFGYDKLQDIGEPKLHPNCGCWLERMKAIAAGEATSLGTNGADWWMYYLKELPKYYITREAAKNMGWHYKRGNLWDVAPGCMIFGGIYKNKDRILPAKNGRIWYEADINYNGGYRNQQRLLFSNDGLVFVSYDHYETFAEIIGEER